MLEISEKAFHDDIIVRIAFCRKGLDAKFAVKCDITDYEFLGDGSEGIG